MTSDNTLRILTVGAHPDDIEFGCGGVLIKEAAAGSEIFLVLTSRGEAGTSGTPEIRESETMAAARLLNADNRISYLDFGGDGKQQDNSENAIQLARLIRDQRPDCVLAPLPTENQHPDHAVVGRVARTACRLARYGGLSDLQSQPPHKTGSLWFYAVTPGIALQDISPVRFDISEWIDKWKQLMECHQSQVTNRQYIDLQISRARQFGLLSGCDYAAELWPNDPPLINRIAQLATTSRTF